MSAVKDGGTAFPYEEGGMSLRDHFAGLAMQGMFASDTESWNEQGHWEARAGTAYAMADAMLARREKGTAT